ncbi:MAG: sigma-54-dependent Fis family transcriptional regulator [Planctomycetota bacterium]|nr:sigma-54-dependent Fis family transcriptional regulator [Planctomycetota bacterium]
MDMITIFVIDDQVETLEIIKCALEAPDRRIYCFANPAEALEEAKDQSIDIVLTDLRMPGMTGLDVLREIKAHSAETEVILMTAFAEVEMAVQSIKQGASDFFTKPLRIPELQAVIGKLVELQSMRRRLKDLSGDGVAPVGTGETMQRVVALARTVAETDSSVLILGETGVGKEILANYIQRISSRANGPYVKVNCAALPESLLESELFGHEKGSFTGAAERRIGRFERAHRGTLFLDEIAELPHPVQVKLLRVLQNQEIERLGGNQPIVCNFRLVCATHRNIDALIEEQRFREDLYYRINVFPIEIPPLRERTEDIPALAMHFLRRVRSKIGHGPHEIHPSALLQLTEYAWPGNVRELENVIERACVLARGQVLTPDLLRFRNLNHASEPRRVTLEAKAIAASAGGAKDDLVPVGVAEAEAASGGHGTAHASGGNGNGNGHATWNVVDAENPLEEAERVTLKLVLERCGWNYVRAAQVLKLSRSTLYAKASRYGIKR